jgi:hypothetical protein
VDGENQVYLDLTHVPAETLTRKLGAILEIYEMFVGDDPRYMPMRIFPGVHYSMGGCGLISNSDESFPDFSRRANAIIRFTALIVLARILWFPEFTADSSPRRRRLITRKTSSAEIHRNKRHHAANSNAQEI